MLYGNKPIISVFLAAPLKQGVATSLTKFKEFENHPASTVPPTLTVNISMSMTMLITAVRLGNNKRAGSVVTRLLQSAPAASVHCRAEAT